MELKDKEKIIEKIIKEQDMVALYTYNNFNKSLGIMQEYAEGVYYSRLKDFIIQNPIIIDSFSVKNLYTLIASIPEIEETKEVKKRINQKLAERLESEDFYCEDIDSEVFLRPIHTSNAYGRIEENLRGRIRRKIIRRTKNTKRN